MRAEPYYRDDAVTLYHGDCLDIDAWLAADVLVTDPPYGIDWNQPAYLATTRKRSERTRQHDGIANDGDTSARDEALARFAPKPYIAFGAIKAPFPSDVRTVLVWRKPADAGLFGSVGRWRRDWEPVFIGGHWAQSPATSSAVLDTRAGSHRSYAQGVHPHGKPLDVMESLIEACPPGTIADPFAGSGSTLVAARNLGRKAIGVEIEERYCEIIARRLAADVLDFGAPA